MRAHYRRGIRLGALVAVSSLAACRGDTVAPEVPDVTNAFWALTLDHRAIALTTAAPHHTIQLTAVPRTPSGAPLEGLPAPTYVSANTDVVRVSATGLVTARAPAFAVPVVARLTAGGITHVDSAFVNVLPGPAPTLASFSIRPPPGDSAKFGVTGTLLDQVRILTPVALDAMGNPMPVPVHFRTLDHTVARIDAHSGLLAPVRRGNVTFIATTTAFGVAMADTLPYRIGTALQAGVIIQPTAGTAATHFSPPNVTIGTGGIVGWQNLTGRLTDVVFEDPSDAEAVPEHWDCPVGLPCDPGNIPAFGTSEQEMQSDPVGGRLKAFRFRRFSSPGTYTYRSTLFKTTGTIVVVDESQ